MICGSGTLFSSGLDLCYIHTRVQIPHNVLSTAGYRMCTDDLDRDLYAARNISSLGPATQAPFDVHARVQMVLTVKF